VQELQSERDGLARQADQLRTERSRIAPELEQTRVERDKLAQELEQFRQIEHSLAQTLALAEEHARTRRQQAEDEAQRVLGEARTTASQAAIDAEANRDRAVADVVRIRQHLTRALSALDVALEQGDTLGRSVTET
jgi:cell division septum initiation protein DivIVA